MISADYVLGRLPSRDYVHITNHIWPPLLPGSYSYYLEACRRSLLCPVFVSRYLIKFDRGSAGSYKSVKIPRDCLCTFLLNDIIWTFSAAKDISNTVRYSVSQTYPKYTKMLPSTKAKQRLQMMSTQLQGSYSHKQDVLTRNSDDVVSFPNSL